MAQPHTLVHQRLPGRSTLHPHSHITEADHVAKAAISVGKYIYPQDDPVEATQWEHIQTSLPQECSQQEQLQNPHPLSIGFEP